MASMAPVGAPPATTNANAAVMPVATQTPSPSAAAGPMPVTTSQDAPPTIPGGPPGRLPTMGTGEGIALPMIGPSRRTIVIAGVAIATAGIAAGTFIGWRAFSHRAVAAPTPPETNVALVEQPELLPRADAGAMGDASAGGGRATGMGGGGRGAMRGARGTNVASAGGNGTRTGATHAAVDPSQGGGDDTDGPGTTGGSNTHAGATSTHTTGTSGTTGTTGTTHGGTGSTASNGSGSTGGANNSAANQLMLNNIATGGTQGTPIGPAQSGYYEAGDVTDATGHMDPSVFQFVYQHYRPQIAACHSMVERGNDVQGLMRVRIRLGTDGHVVRTRIVSDTTHNTALENCIQTSIHSWRYPQPEGGEVEFEYNFGFGS